MNSRIVKTLIACTLIIFYVSQKYVGAIILFVVIVLIISFLSSAYICYKNPKERKVRAIKALIWIAGLVIASLTHFYMHTKARDSADTIVKAVELYHQENNKYPNTLEEIGFSKKELHGQRIFYNNEDPLYLVYPSTFIPYDKYEYDFENHRWEYHPD